MPTLDEPITATPPPSPNDEPLQRPPNAASSHQRAEPPNSDTSGAHSNNILGEILGPVGGVMGGAALAGGGYLLNRRRRKLQQQAAANATGQPLNPNTTHDDSHNTHNTTNDHDDSIIDDGTANGGANSPANARGGGGGANGLRSPAHGSAAGSPTQPNAADAAAANALNLSLNRDHTAAAVALNDCLSPEMQNHSLAYREWLFDRGMNPDLVIQGTDESRDLVRQFRLEYGDRLRRAREGEEARRQANDRINAVLLNPAHMIPLQPLQRNAAAAANQSHESIDETAEEQARNLTDRSFHSDDAEDGGGGGATSTPRTSDGGEDEEDEENEEGGEDGTAQANNNEEVVVVGANGRPKRSDRARRSPDRLGAAKNTGSKYNRKIGAKK